MKGVIAQCLVELVESKFGNEKMKAILEKSGLPASTKFLATSDIEDGVVMALVKNTCSTIGITLEQAADAFGEHWVTKFAPRIYKPYFSSITTAKDFLLKMDLVHEITTRNIPNAKPPRFNYEWKGDKKLIMTYKSSRGLIDFFVGLIKGVGKYFNEPLTVAKIGPTQVEIVFGSKQERPAN